MKLLKLVLIAAIVAPMFLVSCGDKQDGEYSMSFDVPDSVAYSLGASMGSYLQRQGVQSVDFDEFSKGMKAGFALKEEEKNLVDSARFTVQTFQQEYGKEQQAKMKADTNYIPVPMDFPKSESYSIGVILGDNLIQSNFDKVDVEQVLSGVKGQLSNSSKYAPEATAEILEGYFVLTDSLRIKVNEQYLADNKEKEGVITTPSGLQYRVITEGEGEKPSPENQVKVHYKGTFVDGKTFDSSYDRGEPVTFPLNGVIPGWTEGVGLMNVGSKYELVIPHEIGYGERGNQGIPPKSTLVFEVELLEILPAAQQQPQMPEMTEEQMKKMIEEAQKNAEK
jgi:FKBP-type peptidyl-prolyl cis-trans isomerase